MLGIDTIIIGCVQFLIYCFNIDATNFQSGTTINDMKSRAILILLSLLMLTTRSLAEDTIQFATVCVNYRYALEELAREYEKTHPGVKVKLSFVSEEFATWIRTRVAAGGDLVPDIYNANYTHGYGELGHWVDLVPYLEAKSPYTNRPWQESLDAALLERYSQEGKKYQLSIDYIDIAVFYNKEIFAELGLKEPKTWDEWLSHCEIIKKNGYVPIAIGGDAMSFWAGDMGWLVRLLGDVYLRNLVPDIMSRPGDWDYKPERNANWTYDPTNVNNDMRVTINTERRYNAILDGSFDFSSERFQRIYFKINELLPNFQPGFMGIDTRSAQELFYTKRAAMVLMASPEVTGLAHTLKKMDPKDRFEFGNFWIPTITDDPLACGPFRGVGGGGMVLAVMKKKDPEHEKNVIDFLQYITTPEAGRILIERTLENDQSIIGPILIKGVKLPEDLADKYDVFTGHGFSKINFRGLDDEQESVNDWVVIAQEFLGGRMNQERFGQEYNALMKRAVHRIVGQRGLDLDPTTKDAIPHADATRNRWNPFENGSLMLLIIVCAFIGFATWHIKKASGMRRRQTVGAYALLFPTFFILATFNYFPALSGLYHAFTEWESGRAAVFNGLDNFRLLIHDRAFFIGIGNMLILLAAGLFKAIVIPFIAAELILFLMSKRLQWLFRTLFLLPMVVPGMVGILIWRFIYNPNTGLLNQALTSIGLEGLTRNWLGDPSTALGSIIGMGFPWIGAFGLLIYMAGLLQIPESVNEAFSMESTNVFKRIWYVDIPLVRGQVRMLAILTFIGSVQNFQTILILTRGGPGTATYVPALRMYYQAFTYSHFGYGAAIGLVLFCMILVITIINMKVLKPVEAT